MTIHRESLIRANFNEVQVTDEGNTLVGYAAVFDTPTEINGWEGHFMERIAPGAFAKTLTERGNQIKVLFNHGHDPSVGDKPLGVPRVMREDDHGLYVEVPLADTSYNADLRELVRVGAIDGMSFRFTVPQGRDEWDDSGELPVRTIREVKLYEFGPVTFPAYAATTAGIRGGPAFRDWLSHPEITPEPINDDSKDDAASPGTSSSDAPPTAPAALSQQQRRQTLRRLTIKMKGL